MSLSENLTLALVLNSRIGSTPQVKKRPMNLTRVAGDQSHQNNLASQQMSDYLKLFD